MEVGDERAKYYNESFNTALPHPQRGRTPVGQKCSAGVMLFLEGDDMAVECDVLNLEDRKCSVCHRQLTYQALLARDYPLIQGVFQIVAVSILVVNFAIDLLYPKLDPRIDYAH